SGTLPGAQTVGVTDLRSDGRGRRGPITAREARQERTVGIRSRQDVVLDWRRRTSPLAIDTLSAFVDEHRGVTGPRMELSHRVRHDDVVRIAPGSGTDPIASVRRLIAIRGVTLDAEVRSPCPR